MAEQSRQADIDRLLARFVDDNASHDDLAALEAALLGNVDAQRRYVRYLDLDAELAQRSASGQWLAGAEPVPQSRMWSRPRLAVAAVIATVIAAGILLLVGWRVPQWQNGVGGTEIVENADDLESERTDDGVAVLTHAVDVDWLMPNTPRQGDILSPGVLKLKSGLIQVEFYSGARLIVEGPADFDIESVASVICREGKLRSLVPPRATGFSVLTPKFEVVDLGTEFAVDVTRDGQSRVHVFDGKVELYGPDGNRGPEPAEVLLGGNAAGFTASGARTAIAPNLTAFTSFEDVRARELLASQERFAQWKTWNKSLQNDPRIVTRYDFESNDSRLIDVGTTKSHGTIVGCEWTTGRWPQKRALEFKRPGDRVRIDVPGEFDAITLTAWVRVDALPQRRQSLLLTDGYEIGHLHWQIGLKGDLRLGTRIPSQGPRFASGYGSQTAFTPRQIGVWNFVCSVYDRSEGIVSHWFNSEQVFRGALEVDQPIRVGVAEIGNWGMPLLSARQPVRNFIGRMDELTIWNVALDEQQIAEFYGNSRP